LTGLGLAVLLTGGHPAEADRCFRAMAELQLVALIDPEGGTDA
jgi:hypothetical protein